MFAVTWRCFLEGSLSRVQTAWAAQVVPRHGGISAGDGLEADQANCRDRESSGWQGVRRSLGLREAQSRASCLSGAIHYCQAVQEAPLRSSTDG